MRHSTGSSLPIPRAVRKRAKTSALCLIVFVIVGFTFFYDASSLGDNEVAELGSGGRQILSKYLDAHLPWSRPQPKPVDWLGEDVANIDPIPAIPPTLQDDVTLDDDIFSGVNRLPDHTWDLNGLVTANSDGAHPIYELIRRSQASWDEKNRKASKTLMDAVKEYERRYGRPPPLGFDAWWKYAKDHNVRLPDEYDQIHRDLEPYWGIDPVDLRASQYAWEGHRDSWSIGKNNWDDPVTLVNASLPDGALEQYMSWGVSPQLMLMRELWQYVPPFRATFSPHDAPNERVEWTWKAAALDAAKRGVYLKPEDLPPQDNFGWATLCPPGSPGNIDPPPHGAWPTPQQSKTFIHDHFASMDVCQHPQLLLLHGNFVSAGSDPIPDRFPAPQFSNCATSLHADIRAISAYATDEFLTNDTPWSEKADDRLAWRGGPTGMWHVEEPNINWRGSQRVRFVNLTSGRVGAGSSFEDSLETVRYLGPSKGPDEPVGELVERRRGAMNAAMMDVGFAGDYGNCEGVACDIMAEELGRKDWKTPGDLGAYKYLFDVDGNGWSARFRRLMSSYSVVFKATVFAEWFTDRIQPWVHYVPVQMDYSDLYDSLVFFAGDLAGDGAHDDEARRIGQAGRDWVSDYWRKEDMVAYMFRLWLEYARVMSIDRKDMNYQVPPDS